jgi:hypothetical protein
MTALGIAAYGCSPRTAPSDAAPESSVAEGGVTCTLEDAGRFPTQACGRETEDGGLASCGPRCADGTCGPGCRVCVVSRDDNALGWPSFARAGSMARCPARVCQPAELPAGCESCELPGFCVPETEPVDGGPRPCESFRVQACSAESCPPGCRTLV